MWLHWHTFCVHERWVGVYMEMGWWVREGLNVWVDKLLCRGGGLCLLKGKCPILTQNQNQISCWGKTFKQDFGFEFAQLCIEATPRPPTWWGTCVLIRSSESLFIGGPSVCLLFWKLKVKLRWCTTVLPFEVIEATAPAVELNMWPENGWVLWPSAQNHLLNDELCIWLFAIDPKRSHCPSWNTRSSMWGQGHVVSVYSTAHNKPPTLIPQAAAVKPFLESWGEAQSSPIRLSLRRRTISYKNSGSFVKTDWISKRWVGIRFIVFPARPWLVPMWYCNLLMEAYQRQLEPCKESV